MKITKQIRRDAKSLFRACRTDGALDEGKVRQALDALAAHPPRGYAGILAYFHRLVKLDLERRRAVVESAVELAPALQQSLRESLSRKHGPGLNFTFAANPALIAGVRVRVGSDVYDGSIQARLAALEESF